MASSTLVKDVLYRASVQLHDTSPQFTRWTQREMVAAANDGQRAIAKYLPSSCARLDVIKLAPGTRQSIDKILAANIKPTDGSAAADVFGNVLQSVVRNMGNDGLTPGRAVRLIDREILDVNQPDWHTITGTSVSQFTFDPRNPKTFYVTPGVPGGGLWVEASYLANPVEISPSGSYGMDGTSTTLLSIDDKYVDDLLNYILARCYMKDAEFAGNAGQAQAHSAQFVGSINAQAAALTGVNPNLRSLPLNPNVATPTAQG